MSSIIIIYFILFMVYFFIREFMEDKGGKELLYNHLLPKVLLLQSSYPASIFQENVGMKKECPWW